MSDPALNPYTVVMLKEPVFVIVEGIINPANPGEIERYTMPFSTEHEQAKTDTGIFRDPANAQVGVQRFADTFPDRYFFAFMAVMGVTRKG